MVQGFPLTRYPPDFTGFRVKTMQKKVFSESVPDRIWLCVTTLSQDGREQEEDVTVITRNILTLATPSLSILSMYCLMLLVFWPGLLSVMLIMVVKRPAILTWYMVIVESSRPMLTASRFFVVNSRYRRRSWQGESGRTVGMVYTWCMMCDKVYPDFLNIQNFTPTGF